MILTVRYPARSEIIGFGGNGLNPSGQPSGNPFRPSWYRYQSSQAPPGLIGKFARTLQNMNCFTGASYKKSNSQDWLCKFKTLRSKIVTDIRNAKNTSLFDFPNVDVILRSSGT